MTGTKIRFSLLACVCVLAMVLNACNNDIFVKGDIRPSVDQITLNGDGGSDSFTFSTDGLKSINLSGDGFTMKIESSEIDVAGMWNKFQVSVSDSRVNVKSVGNASGREIEYLLNFDYGYIVCSVAVKILPGVSPVVQSVDYVVDKAAVNAQPKVMTTRTAYNNQSAEAMKIYLYPLKNSESSARIELDNYYHNSEVFPAEMRLPVFNGKNWMVSDKKTEVLINGTVRYFAGIDEEPYVLELAPGQSVILEISVKFYTLWVPFFMELYSSSLDFTNMVTGNVYVTQPTEYTIRIE